MFNPVTVIGLNCNCACCRLNYSYDDDDDDDGCKKVLQVNPTLVGTYNEMADCSNVYMYVWNMIKTFAQAMMMMIHE